MAEIVENSKNYSIIRLTEEDSKLLNFGNNGKCLCATCNNIIEGNINYLIELNDTLCNKCLDNFLERHGENKDIMFTKKYFNYYKKLLGLV